MVDRKAKKRLVFGSTDTPLACPSLRESADVWPWERTIRLAARRRAWFLGRETEASDLAQEARLRVLLVSRTKPVTIGPYMSRVVANAILAAASRWRARGMFEELTDNLQAAPVEDTDVNALKAIGAWAKDLPATLRNLYRMLYHEERTQREAAAMLGVSQPRVAQLHQALLKRGRRELRHLAP